ncbi:MAG: hypothetical protein IJC78_05110 [Clostridia bacterium]|nr:hypothetical protein [Clostridia bacterium]
MGIEVYICAGAAFLFSVLYVALIFWGAKGNLKLWGKKKLLAISACLLLSICLWRMAYSVYVGFSGWNTFFTNLSDSIKTFLMEEGYESLAPKINEVVSHIPGMPKEILGIVALYSTLLFFAAPITGAVVILEFIIQIFSKVKQYAASKRVKREAFYFSELNESTYAMAKSILEAREKCQKNQPIMLFLNTHMEQEEEKNTELSLSAKALGAICVEDDILHAAVRKCGKNTIVLGSMDEMKNVQTLVSLAEENCCHCLNGADVILFSNGRSFYKTINDVAESLNGKVGKMPQIRAVNGYNNMVKNVLKDMPLYEPLVGRKIPEETDELPELNLTILGAGNIGTEMFLSAYWYGQILGYQLCINVVSQESEESFIDRIEFINSEIFGTSERIPGVCKTSEQVEQMFSENGRTKEFADLMRLFPDKEETAVPYMRFRYLQTDIKDDDFSRKLNLPLWEDGFCLQDTDYFVVALGTDADNLMVAEKLNKYISEYHLKQGKGETKNTVISYAIYNSALCRMLNACANTEKEKANWRTYMYAFGSFDEVFAEENIYMSSEKAREENIYASYSSDKVNEISYDAMVSFSDKKEENRGRTQYDYWANITRALHLRYKVFSAGYINASVFLCDSVQKRNKMLEQALVTYRKELIPFVDDDEALKHAKKTADKYKKLTWLEHRRWCAFMRVSGFTKPENFEMYYRYTKSHKEMSLKLHPCLVEATAERGTQIFETERKTPDALDCLDTFSRNKYYVFKKWKEEEPEKTAEITVEMTDYKSYDAPGYAFYCNANEEIVSDKDEMKEK